MTPPPPTSLFYARTVHDGSYDVAWLPLAGYTPPLVVGVGSGRVDLLRWEGASSRVLCRVHVPGVRRVVQIMRRQEERSSKNVDQSPPHIALLLGDGAVDVFRICLGDGGRAAVDSASEEARQEGDFKMLQLVLRVSASCDDSGEASSQSSSWTSTAHYSHAGSLSICADPTGRALAIFGMQRSVRLLLLEYGDEDVASSDSNNSTIRLKHDMTLRPSFLATTSTTMFHAAFLHATLLDPDKLSLAVCYFNGAKHQFSLAVLEFLQEEPSAVPVISSSLPTYAQTTMAASTDPPPITTTTLGPLPLTLSITAVLHMTALVRFPGFLLLTTDRSFLLLSTHDIAGGRALIAELPYHGTCGGMSRMSSGSAATTLPGTTPRRRSSGGDGQNQTEPQVTADSLLPPHTIQCITVIPQDDEDVDDEDDDTTSIATSTAGSKTNHDDDLVESLVAATTDGDILRLDVSLEPAVIVTCVGSGPCDPTAIVQLSRDCAVVLAEMGPWCVFTVDRDNGEFLPRETVTNSCPVIDMTVAHDSQTGKDTVFACTGSRHGGGIMEVQSAAAVTVVSSSSEPDFDSVTGMWSLNMDKIGANLVLAFAESTAILERNGGGFESELEDVTDVYTGASALHCISACSIKGSTTQPSFILVHRRGVCVYVGRALTAEWNSPAPVEMADVSEDGLIVMGIVDKERGAMVIVLRATVDDNVGQIHEIAKRPTEKHISCLRIVQLGVSPLIVVGTYAPAISVLIIGPQNELVLVFEDSHHMDVPQSAAAMSQAAAKVESLLIGTRDGSLLHYEIKTDADARVHITRLKVHRLGVYPVRLVYTAEPSVLLALCDQPWRVTLGVDGGLNCKTFSCEQLTDAAPFGYGRQDRGQRPFMAVTKSGHLQMLNLALIEDPFQRAHMRHFALHEGPRRITYLPHPLDKLAVATVRTGGHGKRRYNLHILDRHGGKILFTQQLLEGESVLALKAWPRTGSTPLLLIGLSSGRFLVGDVHENNIRDTMTSPGGPHRFAMDIVASHKFASAVACAIPLGGRHVVVGAGENVHVMCLERQSTGDEMILTEVCSTAMRWPVTAIDAQPSKNAVGTWTLVVGSQRDAMTFYEFSEAVSSLEFIRSERDVNCVADCTLIGDESALAVERCGNVYGVTGEPSSSSRKPLERSLCMFIGDLSNRVVRASLVQTEMVEVTDEQFMDVDSSAIKSPTPAASPLIIGGLNGSLLELQPLSSAEYSVLRKLEQALYSVNSGASPYAQQQAAFRSAAFPQQNIIDGDFLTSMFSALTVDERDKVAEIVGLDSRALLQLLHEVDARCV